MVCIAGPWEKEVSSQTEWQIVCVFGSTLTIRNGTASSSLMIK